MMPQQNLLQDWMKTTNVRTVMKALNADGAEVRFVGGCVRDAILNRPINDIDIATEAKPEAVMDLLCRSRIKAIPTGIRHGTITALVDSQPFEITTLRRDLDTDGRHAKVIFTNDWQADAERRDFTINALSLSPNGQIFDYVGGRQDILLGKVRFVGNAKTRIKEDVLRILRFYRFFADYGIAPANAEARAACCEMAPLLKQLSGDRTRHEILKLLASRDPTPSVKIMQIDGILSYCLTKSANLDRLKRLITIEKKISTKIGICNTDVMLRLTALVDNNTSEITRLAKRLNLPNRFRRRLEAATGPTPDEGKLEEALYKLGSRAVRDRLVLAWSLVEGVDLPFSVLSTINNWRNPTFPLTGQDGLAAGMAPGPELGHTLSIIEDWWVDNNFLPDREHCLKKLRGLISYV